MNAEYDAEGASGIVKTEDTVSREKTETMSDVTKLVCFSYYCCYYWRSPLQLLMTF